jgi:hypothetical protein
MSVALWRSFPAWTDDLFVIPKPSPTQLFRVVQTNSVYGGIGLRCAFYINRRMLAKQRNISLRMLSESLLDHQMCEQRLTILPIVGHSFCIPQFFSLWCCITRWGWIYCYFLFLFFFNLDLCWRMTPKQHCPSNIHSCGKQQRLCGVVCVAFLLFTSTVCVWWCVVHRALYVVWYGMVHHIPPLLMQVQCFSVWLKRSRHHTGGPTRLRAWYYFVHIIANTNLFYN